MQEERIPALRPVDVVSVLRDGREFFVLRDPQSIAAEPLILSAAAAGLLRFFDGRHSSRDIQLAMARASGTITSLDQIRAFVAKLDANHYLDSDAFRRHRADLARAYADAGERPARFAGVAYPDEPAALRASLSACYSAAEGPGLPQAAVGSCRRGSWRRTSIRRAAAASTHRPTARCGVRPRDAS